MASVIKLKRSTTASSIPTTSDLEDGEIALNITDKKMFVRNGASIVTVLNYSTGEGGGSGDLTAIASNLIPDTDTYYDIGSLAYSFKNIVFGEKIQKKVRVYTEAGGISTPQANFGFNINTNAANFTEVYTASGGLSDAALGAGSTDFDDDNPAFLF